jgi:hypothetical protein
MHPILHLEQALIHPPHHVIGIGQHVGSESTTTRPIERAIGHHFYLYYCKNT